MAATSQQTSSTLLNIPAEVRNGVYTFLTPEKCTFQLEDGHKLEDCTQYSSITTPLFLTHPTISQEATAMLYTRNHFSFDSERDATTFIHTIGTINAAAITSVFINSAWDPVQHNHHLTRCLLPHLCKLKGLRSLEIQTTDWPTIADEATMDYLMIPQMRERLPWLVKTYTRREGGEFLVARLARVDVALKEDESEFET